MPLILISDMHICSQNPICRTDNMLQAQNEKLDFLIEYANQTKSNILSAGDQTDKPRDFLSLWILANKLKKLNKNLGFYCVLGQHDKFCRSDQPSTMKILNEFGYAKFLSKEPEEISGYNIYGCDFGDDPIEPETENNILVVHDSICTRELAIKNIELKDAEEYATKHNKYKYIVTGDIHRRFSLKTKCNTILNSGPMLRDDSSEYFLDYEPGFYFLDNDEIKMVKFPHKKDVISRLHIKEKNETSKIQLNVQKGENKDIVDLIKTGIEQSEFDKEQLNGIIW